MSLYAAVLLALSPIGFRSQDPPVVFLFAFANIAFPVVFWSFGWHGPLWGLAAMVWTCAVVGFVGLMCREAALLWIPGLLCAFAAISHWGMEWRRSALRSAEGRAGRVEERLNALGEQLLRAEDAARATESRLQQYQRLRRVANVFAGSLQPEDLYGRVVESTGDLIPAADRVLLYGVDPKGLHLALRRVWRRSGSVPVREKRGDAFDHWVMRQGQPLLVEEVARDFRFQEAAPETIGRPLEAVLVVPMVTPNRFLGVLRLESAAPRALNADDLRLVGIVADLASLSVENSTLYARMAQLAITDDLTGLAVRAHFEKELAGAMKRAKEGRSSLGLLLIDIDRFKVYNDGFGHSAGDKLLRQMGQLLAGLMRPGDLAARYGGEEFVCFLGGATRAQAAHRADQIRQNVEQASVLLRRTITRTTVSIGVSAFPEDAQTAGGLMEAADQRLYRAKGAGRNRVCAE